jgi:hypothetical protein
MDIDRLSANISRKVSGAPNRQWLLWLGQVFGAANDVDKYYVLMHRYFLPWGFATDVFANHTKEDIAAFLTALPDIGAETLLHVFALAADPPWRVRLYQ